MNIDVLNFVIAKINSIRDYGSRDIILEQYYKEQAMHKQRQETERKQGKRSPFKNPPALLIVKHYLQDTLLKWAVNTKATVVNGGFCIFVFIGIARELQAPRANCVPTRYFPSSQIQP